MYMIVSLLNQTAEFVWVTLNFGLELELIGGYNRYRRSCLVFIDSFPDFFIL